MTPDPWQLDRFVQAQSQVYPTVVSELAAANKQSHWMWFVFPQLKALGFSATAKKFGIQDAAEARAYWEHPVLGARLEYCAGLVLEHRGKSAISIFGPPDELKLRSCMTLFARVAPECPRFSDVIEEFFDGAMDATTLALLSKTNLDL